jgi:hypothetical protein
MTIFLPCGWARLGIPPIVLAAATATATAAAAAAAATAAAAAAAARGGGLVEVRRVKLEVDALRLIIPGRRRRRRSFYDPLLVPRHELLHRAHVRPPARLVKVLNLPLPPLEPNLLAHLHHPTKLIFERGVVVRIGRVPVGSVLVFPSGRFFRRPLFRPPLRLLLLWLAVV